MWQPKAAYVHSSTTANTVGNSTILDVAAANNNPNAIILVTALDYVFCEKNVGVWYNTSTGKMGNILRRPNAYARRS